MCPSAVERPVHCLALFFIPFFGRHFLSCGNLCISSCPNSYTANLQLLDHRHLRLSDGVTEYYQGRKWVDPLNCYFPEAIRRVVVVSSTCKMPDWEIRVKVAKFSLFICSCLTLCVEQTQVEGVVRLDASLAEEWFAHLQGRKLHSLVGEQQRLSWARSHSKPRRGTVHELSHHRTPEMVRRNTSSSSPSRRQSIR